jgi:hypothetical protein
MKTFKFIVAALAGLTLLAGCGGAADPCAWAANCADEQGVAFNEKTCQRQMKTVRDNADSAGCVKEYDEYMNCATEEKCSVTSDDVAIDCAKEIRTLASCAQ